MPSAAEFPWAHPAPPGQNFLGGAAGQAGASSTDNEAPSSTATAEPAAAAPNNDLHSVSEPAAAATNNELPSASEAGASGTVNDLHSAAGAGKPEAARPRPQGRVLNTKASEPLPQVTLLKLDNGAYYRTVWNDNAEIGKGFQRANNEFLPTAVAFTPAETADSVTKQSMELRC